MMLFISMTVSAQVINFRTTSYTSKEYTPYGWTNWRPYQNSNMLLTIDIDSDLITIYSPRTQYYKIIEYDGAYIDKDRDETIRFKFIDQDGDRGTIRLMQRRNGKSEVYIQFPNVMWVYSIIRL